MTTLYGVNPPSGTQKELEILKLEGELKSWQAQTPPFFHSDQIGTTPSSPFYTSPWMFKRLAIIWNPYHVCELSIDVLDNSVQSELACSSPECYYTEDHF